MGSRSVRKRLTQLLLGASVVLATVSAWAELAQHDPRSALKGLIDTQQVIRVWISSAPGFGHQAATVTVMKRARQLGYSGTFEVVYAGSIAHKLSTLLPGFQAEISTWQEISGQNIKAISYAEFVKQTDMPQRTLGFTGADDDLEFMRPEKLHVQHYLRLQPLGWGESHLLSLGNSKPQMIPGLGRIGYTYEVHDTDESVQRALEDMRRVPNLSGKVAGLETILNQGASIEIGAIYGVGLIGDVSGRLRFWVESIRAAQRASPESFRNGVILPILSGLNEVELRALNWELKNLSDSSPRGAGRVGVIGVEDPALAAAVRDLGSGDVLLVPTGQVIQSVFEILFKRSRLPILVAGKNAANLAQLLGKSYLNTVGDYAWPGSPESSEARKTISEAASAFHFTPYGSQFKRKTAKFILESLDPRSGVSQIFRTIMPSGRDKVAEALEFAAQRISESDANHLGICAEAF
jgi:hypothetical protein